MEKLMKKTEILAPAGSFESLQAAVKSGADAVYFGATGFNARRNAQNFSEEEFIKAVQYCHIRGVKAYITLNTLVFDSEMQQLSDTLRLIAQSGADAVIVQDLGVAALVKKHCPTLPLHASTQMAVHNASGVKVLKALGFSRVVLARENSFAEIKRIAESTDLEIEVFVHGAHCMSASGMCYMSSALGARSGNRGLCAQPCRLNFKTNSREYALSLKDMSLISHLSELKEAGVCSFKIEGRMKRPEYVAAAVDACQKSLAGLKPDVTTLQSVFSRSGFTDGYFAAKRNLSMFGNRTKEDVVAAGSVLSSLQQLYKDEPKRVGVTVTFSAQRDKPCELTLFDGEHSVSVTGEIPQNALKLPMNEEMCKKNLTKFGGTPYYENSFDCTLEKGLMLSASALNAVRREAVERLNDLRAAKTHEYREISEESPVQKPPFTGTGIRVRFEHEKQIPQNGNFEAVILPLLHISDETAVKYGERLYAELPCLMYPGFEEKCYHRLLQLKEKGLKRVVCENLGGIYLARKAQLEPVGGMMLNVLNTQSISVLKRLGVADVTLSPEMPFAEMKKIGYSGKIGFVGYGHMPLMRFRACPMQGETGCGSCKGVNTVIDRRGEHLTVLCSEKQYSTLLNPVALYTGNLKMPITDFVTLYFSTENEKDVEKVLEAFLNKASYFDRKTSGLYERELL